MGIQTETFDFSTYVLDPAGENFDESKLKPMIERWTAISPGHKIYHQQDLHFERAGDDISLSTRMQEGGGLIADLHLPDGWLPLHAYALPSNPEGPY